MRRTYSIGFLAAAAVIAAALAVYSQNRRTTELTVPPQVTFRILLGIGDTNPANWDGKIAVTGGEIVSIQGWRFAGSDLRPLVPRFANTHT